VEIRYDRVAAGGVTALGVFAGGTLAVPAALNLARAYGASQLVAGGTVAIAGTGVAGVSGGLGDLAGQGVDLLSGYRTSLNYAESLRAGEVTAGSYLLFGEAPITVAGALVNLPKAIEAATDIVAGLNTSAGALSIQELMDQAAPLEPPPPLGDFPIQQDFFTDDLG